MPISDADRIVRVGVAVMLTNLDGQVLFGLRKGNHSGGTWSFPGGHVEYAETPFEAAAREVREETGCDVDLAPLRSCPYVNTLFASGKHYITLYFVGIVLPKDVQPTVREPDKCVEWRWFAPNDLPSPLFEPIRPDLLFAGLR